MVALTIVLQTCAIHARALLDVFCGAVQELHDCLVPVVEKGDLFLYGGDMGGGQEGPHRSHLFRKSPFTDT